MGHRKHNAPRRGSLAFYPRARHQILVPRVRNWTALTSDRPMLAGYPAFKAGMIHAITVDDRERTPNFGKSTFNSATVLSLPEITVCGLRAYKRDEGNDFPFADIYANDLDDIFIERLSLGKSKDRGKTKSVLDGIPSVMNKIVRFSALVGVLPSDTGLSNAVPQVQEIGITGPDLKSQFEYLKGILGKKIKTSEFLKPGAYVDAIGVTKGKGFEGPVTRMGIKRKQHKSRKSVRAVGVISPWHPATVMYTVPRAGQMGFHQRLARNNRILYVGDSRQSPINPKGGFLHFGEIRGEYVVVRGSIPGPTKRLVNLRLPLNRRRQKIQVPRIIEFNVEGKPIQPGAMIAAPAFESRPK